MALVIITGPAHSGKTRFAEALAGSAGMSTVTVVTGPEGLAGTSDVLAPRRPPSWRVVDCSRAESPTLEALLEFATDRDAVVVDTLGSVLEHAAKGGKYEAAAQSMWTAIINTRALVIAVGEELGWSPEPTDPRLRTFRHVLASLAMQLGWNASRVYLVVNGFFVDLKANWRAIDPGGTV